MRLPQGFCRDIGADNKNNKEEEDGRYKRPSKIHMQNQCTTGRLFLISADYFTRFSSFGRFNTSGPYLCVDTSSRSRRPLLWMAPVSFIDYKEEQSIAKRRMRVYGSIEEIQIVRCNGNKAAVWIKNIIPCTPQYIERRYSCAPDNRPAEIDAADLCKVHRSSGRLLILHQISPKLGFLLCDVGGIARELRRDAEAARFSMKNKRVESE